MLIKMETSAMGGGNGYNIDPTKLTDLECVSAWNPGSTTTQQTVKFTDIPYTDNVLYLVIEKNYQQGNWVVGTKYAFTNSDLAQLIFINNGIITNIGYFDYSLDGTTLTSDGATRYGHFGLFVLDKK